MTWTIPLTDVAVPEEDVAAVVDCLRSGWLTMGPRTEEFERAFGEYVGVEHAVAVSSGTAALHLAVLAAGIGPGDEVIVPALTFVASAAAVRYAGALPVFCDIVGAHDLNLAVESVKACITPRTRAVMAVHFLGYPADALVLRTLCDAHGLLLIEDAAQAVGSLVASVQAGTIGELGCFSFFSKHQLCVGEGGMVVTNDETLAATVRRLRSHAMTSVTWDRHRGHAESYDIVDVGFNYRLDEARAALGLSRLPRLDAEIGRRRENARRYRTLLAETAGVEIPWTGAAVEASSHFGFAVLARHAEARTRLRADLAAEGIQTTAYPALTQLTAYRPDGSRPAPTQAESAASRHCLLPLSASMTAHEVAKVAEAVKAAATT
jgi:dTDP-4-amino-4,6-dideoxygalactose transaminase